MSDSTRDSKITILSPVSAKGVLHFPIITAPETAGWFYLNNTLYGCHTLKPKGAAAPDSCQPGLLKALTTTFSVVSQSQSIYLNLLQIHLEKICAMI